MRRAADAPATATGSSRRGRRARDGLPGRLRPHSHSIEIFSLCRSVEAAVIASSHARGLRNLALTLNEGGGFSGALAVYPLAFRRLSREQNCLDQLTLAAHGHAGKALVPLPLGHIGLRVEPCREHLKLRRRNLPALNTVEQTGSPMALLLISRLMTHPEAAHHHAGQTVLGSR